MAGNPRIDDLRKRIDKEPGSRLFAQLAEELRKDGDLSEAIFVAREGLKQHPNYPFARMTLGRAYLDTGDSERAKGEFALVLKGAPDNILASRFLGECLEKLGDAAGALKRYKATLALAPGDKQVMAKVAALERSAGGAPVAPADGAPIPLAVVDTPMVLEQSHERPLPPQAPPSAPGPSPPPPPPAPAVTVAPPPPAPPTPAEGSERAPIPVVAAEEDFELERPYERPSAKWVQSVAAAPPPPAPPGVAESVTEFDFDTGPPEVTLAPVPTPAMVEPEDELAPAEVLPEPEPQLLVQSVPMPVPEARLSAPADPRASASAVEGQADAAAAAPADLTSPTLAELYFNQGFTDKAIEVYRQILEREPGNERYRARMKELEDLSRHLGDVPPVSSSVAASAGSSAPAGTVPVTADQRRAVLERTIARLEGFLAAVRRE